MMDGMTWYLLGVLSGVVLTVGCAVLAFCSSAKGLDDQGEPANLNPHKPPFRTPPPPPATRTELSSWKKEQHDG